MQNSLDSNSDISFQLDEFYSELRDDGRSIKFLERKDIENRPFPGLRPFKTSEFQLFNGRDGQSEELINRLKSNHFLAVIGSSGTGKSSLIRAGLIPQLLAGYLHEAGTNWDIAICRPGKNPIENLAIALARTKCRCSNKKDLLKEFDVTNPLLNRSQYGILDVNEILNPPGKPEEKSNFLIIIDQFEELFRFDRSDLHKPDLEDHFVNLLLNASSKPDVSIYVIITMRSEFLGDCVKYRGLPEAINRGQYLVPQLNRDQIKEVIEDPILLAGKKIDSGLVELLVNEIEESKTKQDLDQLPILQHALMRTYQGAMKNADVKSITYDHYKSAGGLEHALANHAEKKYKELSDGNNIESPKQKLAKLIFQALTDASGEKKGGRRPTELKNIYAIASSIATEQQVDEVVDHFRDTDTSFIMPPINTSLYPDLFMDISHESLMRQWKTLRDWVTEEAESAKYYLRLVDSANQYSLVDSSGQTKKREKELLSGSELQLALEWQEKYKPTAAWAKRYNQGFDSCLEYLNASEEERKKQVDIENKRKRKVRYLSYTIRGLLILIIIVAGWTIYSINKKNEEIEDYLTKAKIARFDALTLLRKVDSLSKTTNSLTTENKVELKNILQSYKGIGDSNEGGVIISLNETGEHGVVVSEYDLNNGLKTDWTKANNLCKEFTSQGFKDWRLPKLSELKLIYSLRKTAVIKGIIDDLYWSSEEKDGQAYLINFSNGNTSYHFNKNSTHYVRAVRDF